MRRRAARRLLTLALAMATGCGGSTGPADDGGAPVPTAREADRMATDAAYAFLDTYTRDGGRIARLDEGGDTVGEGQAYALLAAAALGDGERFERIWAWTRANVQRPDGLLVFRWADGEVVDPQPASDADLDLAHALLVAACRFDRPDLREEAERVGRAVLESQTATAAGRRVLLAGPWAARDDGLVVNPSYLDPLTLTALQDVTGDARYGEVADAGRAHVGALSDPLPPDWAVVDPDTGDARPVAGPDDREGTPRFSFDAPRTLVRMAVDPSAEGRAVAARAWPAFAGTAPEDLRVEHALDGEPAGDSRSPVTLVAAAGAAQAAGDRDASARLLAGADRLAREHPTYYGAAWVALGRLMLTTPRLRPCAAG